MKEVKIFDRKKLQLLLEKRGLTFVELAKKSGVARQTISNWQQGVQQPQRERLKKVVEHLGCDVEELYYLVLINESTSSDLTAEINVETMATQPLPSPQLTPQMIPDLQIAINKLPDQDEQTQWKVARLIEVFLS